MFKVKVVGIIAISVIVLIFAGCASTTVVESWSNPETGPIKFDKVIVFFFSKDDAVRRVAEDQLVMRMQETKGVAAYTLIPETEFVDLDKVKDRLQNEGFDGAVIMRLVGTEEKKTWVPGSYPRSYYGFYGYYGYARPMVYDPGYLRTDRIVSVETNVYSLAEDKLIWSGLSETFNPDSTVNLVDDVADSVAKDLKAKGLLE